MLECVVNVSQGRRPEVVAAIAAAAGGALLDVHSDPHHHRSVLTLAGAAVEDAVRTVAVEALRTLDLGAHRGAHPRMGVLDVVPYAALVGTGSTPADAVVARDRFARWAGSTLGLPCFCYGPERTLPEVRRRAFRDLEPDAGPSRAHPTAGATAVGWATSRVAGRWAGVTAFAIATVVGPYALRSQLTLIFHVLPPFTAALLAAYLVVLARSGSGVLPLPRL